MKPLSGNKFKVVGIMSGTSLDGLDLSAVEFTHSNNKWEFIIVAAETVKYTKEWKNKLNNAHLLKREEIKFLDIEYGKLIASEINTFTNKINFNPELISSHGHTVFHQPEKGLTLQIGNGFEIAAKTNIQTVADFRTLDVSLGGQGAPLVPIGDKLLFSDYDYCLNLGGFSNISYESEGKRIAFDICPVNLVLNHFAEKQGLPYDDKGKLGKKGQVNIKLLNLLNNLSYYQHPFPKSLGKEWLENTFLPVLNSNHISDSDKLRTVYEHIAIQVGFTGDKGKMLVTGGGAFNSFLMKRIRLNSKPEIVIPERKIVEYKEALIFAFLGVLKIQGLNNCLSSVTGATRDSCCGTIYNG